MASTHFAAMSFTQQPSNQCLDPADLENWVDFNALPSPQAASRTLTSQAPSAMTSPTSTIVPLDVSDDHQTPVAPSHEYARFKQQTGIPTGSMASLRALSDSSSQGFGFSNTGLDNFDMFDSMGEVDFGSSSALPAFFYPPGEGSGADDFVDPSAISQQEEAPANIRFYPGMHQQQAALAKAQAQAQQQRQQQLIQQQQQQKQREAEQQQRQHSRRSASHLVDPRTEETIARVVNQIRQNSTYAGDSMSPNSGNVLPHVVKTRKDDDDMDDDERLLNSEEGKKLSSKERRQLRNKVSARAFRSRRKEYISQLEGELAGKQQEANELKLQNRALTEENARFRNLAEKLLRHPAFHPFLDELSRDPALADSLSKVAGSAVPAQQQQQKDVDPYSASQQFLPQQRNQHVGMALVPEPQLDFASLNLGGNGNWTMQQQHGLPMFQQPQVFAVLEVPEPEPLDLTAISGKGEPALPCVEEEKASYPEIETLSTIKEDLPAAPVKANDPVEEQKEWDFPEDDESVALYANTRRSTVCEPSEPATIDLSEKPHFELVLITEEDNKRLQERLEKMVAKLDLTVSRISNLTSRFDL